MTFVEGQGSTRVILTDHTGVRAKLLFSFEALAYIGGLVVTVCLMGDLLVHDRDFGVSFFILLGIATVCCIAFWRYLSRVIKREELIITADVVTHISKKRGHSLTVEYSVDKMLDMHFIGFEKPIDHPLKSESFDYLGFQTQQQVVNSVMAEGNVGFEYRGMTVRFGIGVPSWDAAALNQIFLRQTGGRLSIAELPEEIPESDWKS